MSLAKDGPSEEKMVESADLTGAREELVEALLRESREELERIDLKASILLSASAAWRWPHSSTRPPTSIGTRGIS